MKRKIFWFSAIILAAAALLIALLLLQKSKNATAEPTQPAIQASFEDTQDRAINLGYGLYLTQVGSYTGPFIEDGSDAAVSGILMIRVENRGETAIEYGSITMALSQGEAQFTLSALMPGQTVILLEQNQLPWSSTEEYLYPLLSDTAPYTRQLSLQQEILSVQPLNGGLNVKNISTNDILGDIVIYYKNKQDGIFYGGITYRLRIPGGLAAGATSQLISDHFRSHATEILFITVD